MIMHNLDILSMRAKFVLENATAFKTANAKIESIILSTKQSVMYDNVCEEQKR